MNFLKKAAAAVLCLLGIATIVAGCSSVSGEKDGRKRVVCTVFPVYELTREIAGDDVELVLMVKPGVEPHDWEPGSDDMMLLSSADLIISCGAGMDPWLDTCLKALEKDDANVCDASKGVNLLNFEDEDHDEEEEHEGHHHHGGVDPHYWLSLENALVSAANIRDSLSGTDPEHKDSYEKRAGDLENDIKQLKASYGDALKDYGGSTIVVSHEAFGYLCGETGLVQLAIDGMSDESEPDAKTVASIIDKIKKDDIKVIYYDSLIDPKVAEMICGETGAKLYELRTFETVTDEEFNKGVTYVSVMTSNLETLKKGLSGERSNG